jgi:hypothetical protein
VLPRWGDISAAVKVERQCGDVRTVLTDGLEPVDLKIVSLREELVRMVYE